MSSKCLFGLLWTNLTYCSGISVIDFEHVYPGWIPVADCDTNELWNVFMNLVTQC